MRFGQSASLIEGGNARLTLAWTAGLLEAEGTFLRPTPAEPRLPIVACQMTDRDVVKRLATTFAATVTTIHRDGRRTVYATRIKGSRAALLMTDLAPVMGRRRQQAITGALRTFVQPARKLSYSVAEGMRARYREGASISELAESFNVARSTVRQVLAREIYGSPAATPWRRLDPASESLTAGSSISPCELHWLAGWLEGEGSFGQPPPSDPGRPRIVARTRDRDVASEVGRLLGVSPLYSHDRRERARGWSPTWRLLSRGQPASQLMMALCPLMGARRRVQIEIALAAARRKVS